MTMANPNSTPAKIDPSAIAVDVDGHQLRLIPSGSARLDALLELIDEAESDLRLLYYMFSEDMAGGAILAALVRAAERGVKVRLLVDGFGCNSVDPEFLTPLHDAGGHFCIFHPSYGRRYLIRNHQKMAIADGRKALVGGANLDHHYLNDDGEERWRGIWVSLEGQAVADLTDYYAHIKELTTARRNRIS